MNDDSTRSEPAHGPPCTADSVGYDPITGTYHVRFDADPSTIICAIVETVATVTDTQPTAMPPLFATVDPEALTDLLASARGSPIEVRFSYEECNVIVSSHGTVVVEPSNYSNT